MKKNVLIGSTPPKTPPTSPTPPLPNGNKIPGKPTGLKFPAQKKSKVLMVPTAAGLVWLGWTGMHMWAYADKINPPPVRATPAEVRVSSCFVDTLMMPRVGIEITNTTNQVQEYTWTVKFTGPAGQPFGEATVVSGVVTPGEQNLDAGTSDRYASSKKVDCKITYASRTQQ